MKVGFTQVYIEAGVNFPFNYLFQRYLSEELTALVRTSSKFLKKYGPDFDLRFYISAKKSLADNEIRGPGVYKKGKYVEYTVFLPYSVITLKDDINRSALQFLFKGVYAVFEKLEIDSSKVLEREDALIDHICSDPSMTEQPRTRFG